MTIFEQYNDAIMALCATHKVKTLYAFGSALGDKFTGDSDVDMIVDFEAMAVESYADNYFDLKFSLQDMFKRSVDLLEEKAIKNPYFKQAISDKRKLIYGY